MNGGRKGGHNQRITKLIITIKLLLTIKANSAWDEGTLVYVCEHVCAHEDFRQRQPILERTSREESCLLPPVYKITKGLHYVLCVYLCACVHVCVCVCVCVNECILLV